MEPARKCTQFCRVVSDVQTVTCCRKRGRAGLISKTLEVNIQQSSGLREDAGGKVGIISERSGVYGKSLHTLVEGD